MNLKEIVAMVEDARMQYEEALVRRFHTAEAKQRYSNLLISYAPELLKAAGQMAEMETSPAESRPKPRKQKGADADGISQA